MSNEQPDWATEPMCFPPTEQELEEAAKEIAHRFSFLDLLAPLNLNIETTNNRQFTHRCLCPMHKQGQERTASFYFSEHKKDYFCFSCQNRGTIIDLMSFLVGRPWFFLVQDFLGKDYEYPTNRRNVNYDVVPKLDLELSMLLREHLTNYEGTPKYQAECQWVDAQFYRIDERLPNLSPHNPTEVTNFRFQILLELRRRQIE